MNLSVWKKLKKTILCDKDGLYMYFVFSSSNEKRHSISLFHSDKTKWQKSATIHISLFDVSKVKLFFKSLFWRVSLALFSICMYAYMCIKVQKYPGIHSWLNSDSNASLNFIKLAAMPNINRSIMNQNTAFRKEYHESLHVCYWGFTTQKQKSCLIDLRF